jgi:hypothetical protein
MLSLIPDLLSAQFSPALPLLAKDGYLGPSFDMMSLFSSRAVPFSKGLLADSEDP